MIIFIAVGLTCLIWGGIKWYKNQKERDKKINLENKELESKIYQLNPSEITEKTLKELDPNLLNRVSDSASILSKAFKIENACYAYIRNNLGIRSYDVKQNLRVGSYEYDIIATSKRNDVDIIYEIKYYPNNISPSRIDKLVEL